MDTFECYKILDLEPGATAEQVRESYLTMARAWDPIKFIDNPVQRQKAEVKMSQIEDAYRNLRIFLPALHPLDQEAEKKAQSLRPENALETLPEADKTLPSWVLTGLVLLLILGILALALGLLLKSGHSEFPVP